MLTGTTIRIGTVTMCMYYVCVFEYSNTTKLSTVFSIQYRISVPTSTHWYLLTLVPIQIPIEYLYSNIRIQTRTVLIYTVDDRGSVTRSAMGCFR